MLTQGEARGPENEEQSTALHSFAAGPHTSTKADMIIISPSERLATRNTNRSWFLSHHIGSQVGMMVVEHDTPDEGIIFYASYEKSQKK